MLPLLPRTQQAYLACVRQLSEHFHKAPEELTPDQRQWVPSRPKFLVHVHPLADHYRTLFRQGLQRDAPDLLKTLPARVWKQRWVVHCQPAGSGEAALRYLSRYVFKTSTSPSAERAGK